MSEMKQQVCYKFKVMMGSDLQPDGLTAGLAGRCQPDKKYPKSQKEKEMIRI